MAGCAALAVTAIAAFFVARALAKAKQRKAVEEARQRMDRVPDHLPHTAERLRHGRF
tara:strand:- start:134 stop:304 length:171 start_codon:yes stop_codon:yes gene_type:complete